MKSIKKWDAGDYAWVLLALFFIGWELYLAYTSNEWVVKILAVIVIIIWSLAIWMRLVYKPRQDEEFRVMREKIDRDWEDFRRKHEEYNKKKETK